ncbi:dihydrofolate reductase [Chitinophaga filiformis]|uniref:Dihydrofolate reductase n=1 Tax=Chitinophaga filiformis TaxID=104663 RepID=A0A1G7R6A5_CHIFI|nr:dihydrofolate reductase [Chitinophaga filiformis]SDG06331.1 dihydrofolate reductase [Chitinophaga filiformis]
MTLSIIVAASENNVIGINNHLPWHLPVDMKYFKDTTMGKPIVMGRKSFEELGRVLPGRPNIMITRQQGYTAEGLYVVPSLEAGIEKAKTFGTEEIFITGGGEIFKMALPIIDRLYLTRVHAEVTGDTYFPEFDPRGWKLVKNERHEKDEKHAYALTFQVWEREK